MSVRAILIFFHCGSNTGYAIEPLERAFLEMGRRLVADDSRIHFAYPNLEGGFPRALPTNFSNVHRFDPATRRESEYRSISEIIDQAQVDTAFGFDQPVHRPVYRVMRRAGVRTLVSYWGAPMSSRNHGMKLAAKRLEVWFRRSKPDHFIFESKAMAEAAVFGRGVPHDRVSVVPLGIDAEEFRPVSEPDRYAHSALGVSRDRRLVVYSGHMEERKGVHVLIRAAVDLVVKHKRKDLHFLILGNQPGEERRFFPLYKDSAASDFITFGGYRDDLARVFPSCDLGVVASTGWDSFPRSAIEMAASGLPLVLSNLGGLPETIEDGQTGYLFQPGNHADLARKIVMLADDPGRRDGMARAARQRVLRHFTVDAQIVALESAVRGACDRTSRRQR